MARTFARSHNASMKLEEAAPPALEPERVHSRLVDRLLDARTVLVFGEITSSLAHTVCQQLLALSIESAEPIRVIVHSPGGHVEAGDTIHDMIRFVSPQVTMIGTGWVASAAALVYCAAERQRRLALPNTRFLLHQPLGGVRGPASDVEIEVQQVLAIRERVERILAEATGQSPERIKRDTERNHWLGAEQALAYGLVGKIVQSAGDVGRDDARR